MRMPIVVVMLFVTMPAVSAEDRFGADNPWFQDFEATCRQEYSMAENCQGGVVGAYAAHANVAVDQVQCDFSAFWKVKDAKFSFREFSVLPWQYGVEALVREDGVCHALNGPGDPPAKQPR